MIRVGVNLIQVFLAFPMALFGPRIEIGFHWQIKGNYKMGGGVCMNFVSNNFGK